MSAKPSETDSNTLSDEPILSELEQLRSIVFGEAKKSIESRIDSIHKELSGALSAMKEQQIQHFSEMQEQFERSLEALDKKIQNVDSHHEENHSSMVKASEALNSQLEMAESSGKDDADALHDRIDKEMAALTASFESKYVEAMEQLAKVSHELTDTKTDRKTLARLLATMASNLETD
ncbi:MAG: chromosome segregation ATPase [Glaciecola sp.]|jgi:chromosome segregation ATPase